MHARERDSLILPRTLGERLLLLVFCSVLTAFFTFMAFALRDKAAAGWLDRLVHGLAVETMFTFVIFSFLAVIWVLFVPRWLESLMRHTFRKVLTAIGIVLAALVFTVMYFVV
jgi:hypothetical protein